MKNLLIALTLNFFAFNIQAQEKKENEKIQGMNQQEKGQYYLQKSKKYKRTGWLLAGTGVGLYGATVLIGNAEIDNGSSGIMTMTTFLVGTGSIVASFPFFFKAANNKGKAQILLQENEIAISMDTRRNIYQRSVGVGIRIGK